MSVTNVTCNIGDKEIKFNNIDELKIQIAEDIKTAKKYF